MSRKIARALLFIIVGCLPVGARAEAGGTSSVCWPEGTQEWGLNVGLAHGHIYDHVNSAVDSFHATVRWAYYLRGVPGERVQNSLEIEAVPLFAIYQSPNAYAEGLTLLLRRSWLRGRWIASGAVGAGLLRSGNEIPQGGNVLNFTPQAGLKLQYLWRKRTAFGVEYRFHHLSNAHRSDFNPGINSHLFLGGISWFLEKSRN